MVVMEDHIMYQKLDDKLDKIVDKINATNVTVAKIEQTVTYTEQAIKDNQVNILAIQDSNRAEIRHHKDSVNISVEKIRDKLDKQTKLYKVIIAISTTVGGIATFIFLKLPSILSKGL